MEFVYDRKLELEVKNEIEKKFIALNEELNKYGYQVKYVRFHSNIYLTSAGGFFKIRIELPERAIDFLGPWEKDKTRPCYWDKVPILFIERASKQFYASEIRLFTRVFSQGGTKKRRRRK